MASEGTTVCPGCGLRLPVAEEPLAPPPVGASPECYALSLEVAAFELDHQALLGAHHQMMVDAYGAQHPGPPEKPIRLGYSLVGLYLAFERGRTGLEVRDAHMRMGKPDARWPVFVRPPGFASVTIADVSDAGARVGSPHGHIEVLQLWAHAVWEWWSPAHEDVAHLTELLLGEWLRR